jgi:hypothetical protein
MKKRRRSALDKIFDNDEAGFDLVYSNKPGISARGPSGRTNVEARMKKKDILRAVVEGGFIIFLFYSNLLMGEFERSGLGPKRGFAWAIEDIFTRANFAIAIVAAIIGYLLFEFLRKRL